MLTPKRPFVLFVCTHNSARSQMAEGLLRHEFPGKFRVASAGTDPAGVHPLAKIVMKEIGIKMNRQRSKYLEEFLGRPLELVVTVCDSAREACPVFPGKVTRVHVDFLDPAAVMGTLEKRLEAFRRTRDAIQKWIREFFSHWPESDLVSKKNS